MNEGAKTGIFWGIAVAMVAIATFVAWPPATDTDTETLIGKPLFPEFQDPLNAASMKIVDFDEEQGTLRSFEVAKDRETGVWTIPSHSGYPADATEQMRNAATSLLDVKILNIAGESSETHDDFGVVEPDIEKLRVGDEGVGRLVSFKDPQGETLAAVIVGKEVRDSENMRYVRIPNQDLVYEINLDVAPLTTKFEDWIEKDLLQLTSLDIQQVDIKNYSVAVEMNGAVDLNKSYDAELELDGSDWTVRQLVTYNENAGAERTLAEGEQLNTQKLNELKDALDDLEIVDVGRKPEGMSADLKADKDILSNRDSFQSLASRGFYPVQTPDGIDVLAANGELAVTLKNGVQYILRFGNVSGLAENADDDENEQAASGGANRYLLVTTRVDESTFPAPDLQPVPQSIEELDRMQAEAASDAAGDAAPQDDAATPAEPAGEPPMKAEDSPAPAADTPPADTPPADTPPADTPPADASPAEPAEPAPADATPEQPADEEASTDPQAVEEVSDQPAAVEADGQTEQSGQGSGSATGGGQQTDEPSEAPEADAPSGAAPAAQPAESTEQPAESTEQPAESTEQPAESTEQPAGAADQAPAAENPPSESAETKQEPVTEEPAKEEPAKEEPVKEETEQEKQERLEFEQERIKKENQRKIDERNDKLEEARRRVRELNARFADWYYVVPESTYGKLQLSLDELIQSEAEAAASEASDPASGVPQFEGFPGGFPGGFQPGQ